MCSHVDLGIWKVSSIHFAVHYNPPPQLCRTLHPSPLWQWSSAQSTPTGSGRSVPMLRSRFYGLNPPCMVMWTLPVFQPGTQLCIVRAVPTEWGISFCFLTRQVSKQARFLVWDVWDWMWAIPTPDVFLLVLCHTCAQMAAVPTLSSWLWPPDGTEDMPAHGCCRLSGALQEVSSLWSGAPPTPSAPSPTFSIHMDGNVPRAAEKRGD